eukprot:6617310-Pyramimonas_sp.AAC.1
MRARSKKYAQSQLRPTPDYLPRVVVPLALPQGLKRSAKVSGDDVRVASREGAAAPATTGAPRDAAGMATAL